IGALLPKEVLQIPPPQPAPAAGGVAVLNRGNVSYCCYPDQTLTLSLMRSCTGWPSGLWIDPPKRTCPDGSGFQLEHWGHRFEYRLLSHTGHWRDSGLWRAGYEYNRPLLAVWGTPSALEPGKDYLVVTPDSIVVTAMKPAQTCVGLPFDATSPRRRIVLRLQEASGRDTTCRISLGWPVGAAWKANLLEDIQEELLADGETIELPLGQFETATVIVELSSARPIELAVPPDRPPQYARWWRYNRGAEPIGFVPASILVGDGQPCRVKRSETLRLNVTVAAGYISQPLEGHVLLDVPDGWRADPTEWTVRLEPEGFETCEVAVEVPPSAAPGQYVLAARLRLAAGPEIYDIAHLALGEEPGALFEAVLEPAVLDLQETGTLRVRIRNLARTRLFGTVFLVSPVEAWPTYDRAEQEFTAEAGNETVVEYGLRAPEREMHGWLWAMAKVMAAGQTVYTDTARIDIGGHSGS
ncbi:MAG: hypothetical protein H5T86_10100, partial [Armatimonadetes bacterium]|nr:hypothetical protein [Armatimonadota bacterium]